MNDKVGSDKQVYRCPECGLRYRSEELAKKCEAWCKEHNSCNLEISLLSIESEKKPA